MIQSCQIRKKMSFSAVPDLLFELDISHTAFKVVAWALGRPDGWVFHIGHMIKTLKLTDKTWPRAKKELMATGFFIQKRGRDAHNKITWENIFVDAPLWENNPIPPKSMYGVGNDAVGKDAEKGPLTKEASKELKKAAAPHKKNLNGKNYFKLPKFGNMILQEGNELDLRKAGELIQKFSIDQINNAVIILEKDEKFGFPSNVGRILRIKKSSAMKPTIIKEPANPTTKIDSLARIAEMRKNGVVRQ